VQYPKENKLNFPNVIVLRSIYVPDIRNVSYGRIKRSRDSRLTASVKRPCLAVALQNLFQTTTNRDEGVLVGPVETTRLGKPLYK
jgi:hypothetical protein